MFLPILMQNDENYGGKVEVEETSSKKFLKSCDRFSHPTDDFYFAMFLHVSLCFGGKVHFPASGDRKG